MQNTKGLASHVIDSLRDAIWPETVETPGLDDLMAEHADALLRGDRRARSYFERLPQEGDKLALLVPLAERVSDALQPVSAPSGFQNRLMADLMQRAQTQCGRPTSVWQEKRTEIIIGATVGSVLSAVGLAYYIYSRMPSHDRNVA